MISLIHPSRSRPELARKAADQWLSNAGCKLAEYILCLDLDKDGSERYVYEFRTLLDSIGEKPCFRWNKSAIEAINAGAQISKGDILVVMSDDFECFPNWGKCIEDLMKGKADWILKTRDSIQPWVITLPIMDRAYYNRFGYIYHPSYKHQFCDTEMTCVAELTGCKVETDIMFKHLNDGPTKIVDELSKRNDATFEDGRRNFIERKNRLFDLSASEIVGKMTPNIYTTMQ